MADTSTEFEYTGGLGLGPAGAMPTGAQFTDENTGPPRPDLPAPIIYVDNLPLVIETNE